MPIIKHSYCTDFQTTESAIQSQDFSDVQDHIIASFVCLDHTNQVLVFHYAVSVLKEHTSQEKELHTAAFAVLGSISQWLHRQHVRLASLENLPCIKDQQPASRALKMLGLKTAVGQYIAPATLAITTCEVELWHTTRSCPLLSLWTCLVILET